MDLTAEKYQVREAPRKSRFQTLSIIINLMPVNENNESLFFQLRLGVYVHTLC